MRSLSTSYKNGCKKDNLARQNLGWAFAEGLVDHVIWQELILATRKRKFFHSNALSFRAIPQIRRFHSERDKVADETGGVICWSADVALGRSAYETLLMIGQYVAGRGLSPTKQKQLTANSGCMKRCSR